MSNDVFKLESTRLQTYITSMIYTHYEDNTGDIIQLEPWISKQWLVPRHDITQALMKIQSILFHHGGGRMIPTDRRSIQWQVLKGWMTERLLRPVGVDMWGRKEDHAALLSELKQIQSQFGCGYHYAPWNDEFVFYPESVEQRKALVDIIDQIEKDR